MTELLNAIGEFALAASRLLAAAASVLRPAIPMLAWAAFWYWAVDWRRLRGVLAAGGIVPMLVVLVLAVFVGIALDGGGARQFGPVPVSGWVSAVGWAAALCTIAFLAGAAQISRSSSRPGIRGVVRAD